MPEGWVWTTVEGLIGVDGIFKDGDWVESKDQDPNGDVRLIQLADLGDGEYLNKSTRFLTSEKARQLRCTYLQEGDVLIARMPEPLGRACLFPGEENLSVTVVDVCIVRLGQGEPIQRWFAHFVNATGFRSGVASLQSGSTRKRISRKNLATVPIPLPPLAEQHRIVEEIERRLSKVKQADASVVASLRRSERLRQSVLKRAFEGKLVPQKPGDEPASVLLERIRAERDAAQASESKNAAGRRGRGRPSKRKEQA